MNTAMKISTTLIDPNSKHEFVLHFPLSRISRDLTKLNVTVSLEGFDGHIQVAYNNSPVGVYQGPYDQNGALHLSIQLPESDLDFEKYTEFRHDASLPCRKFAIKESYNEIDDLEKVDSIAIRDENECLTKSNSDSDDEDKYHYTCQHGNCIVPCPCAPCCNGDEQCTRHKIEHVDRFDANVHAVTIRSTEDFCNDQNFMDKSYYIKHPGIPLDCKKCKRDFLHHVCYHLVLHETCKFCRQNKFKTFAETAPEFESVIKKQTHFLKSVCPYCNAKFCDPYFKKKHVEFEHESVAPFKCDKCSKGFHSKQAKEYHEKVKHTDINRREKCDICGTTFTAQVSLTNHMKYAHSEERLHQCPICDSKFKQKKDKTSHIFNVHGVNTSKAMLGNLEEVETYECAVCDATFKYKKDLNVHTKLKHDKQAKLQKFKCEQCDSEFLEKKSLNAHMKIKHTENVVEFSCPICGKIFKQKNNMKRHQQTHEQ